MKRRKRTGGRTASGRIKKGYRLTRGGGVVKANRRGSHKGHPGHRGHKRKARRHK